MHPKSFFALTRVIDGLDTLDAIEKVPVNAKFKPNVDIVIKKVTIHANPMAG